MVDVDVEVNASFVAGNAVVCGGERSETAGERVETVKGENLDEESERRGIIVISPESSSSSGVRASGLGDENEENDEGDTKEEEKERK